MQLFISFIVIIILFLHATVISSEMICDSGKTCHNNGVCNVEFIDDVSTSWCSCRSNFDGPLCQYRKCPMDNICKNGGICESFGRSIRCHCPIYFGGDFCQDRLPTACDVTDCGNGRCVLLANSLDLAMCECDEGFSGQFCSVVDACKLDSCSFRGECIANGAKDFACICERGFTGKSCEIDIDECQTHACHPGSKCIDKVGEYECECAPGRVGNYCQFEDPCLKADFCKGNGQCFATIRGEPTCLCNDGFTGANCDEDVDECAVGSICGENGQCQNLPGGYFCQCDAYFSGRHCSIAAEPMSFAPSMNLILIGSIIVAVALCVAIIAFCYLVFDKRVNTGKYKIDEKNSPPSTNPDVIV